MSTNAWPAPPGRVVMHIDMDAFYAAIEEKLLPVLSDHPVVVGGAPDARGVATTANYRARQYGVHSAMPLRTAARLCPDALFVSPSFGAYGDYSTRVFAILQHYSPRVEPASVDEAFLDATGMHRHFSSPLAMARCLKDDVRTRLGLTCSVGIAPNKLLAKMASSQYKPDGLYWVDPERVEAWLAPQPTGSLWGIGARTEESLARLGVRTIGDLQRLSLQALNRRFGKWGRVMYQMARGHDDAPVLARHERPQEKSIGHEHTFDRDSDDPVLWHATLLALSDRVGRRLRQHGLRGRTITLKFRTRDFRTRTRAHSLPQATDSEQAIFGVVCRLLEELQPGGQSVRLLGVSVSSLVSPETTAQTSLFDETPGHRGSVTKAVDCIRDRFGADAIRRLGARY